MSDDRALAWSHLLPAGVRYVPSGGPDWWRELLSAASVPDGPPVPVIWGDGSMSTWPQNVSAAVVLINPCAEALNKLRALNFNHVRRFAVLPRLSDARWFIPIGSRRLTAAALQMYTPYRWKARAAHCGAQVAMRLGVHPWHDEVLIASNNRSQVERFLQDAVGIQPAALAVSAGTPGPSRKATLAALDQRGQIRAVCKVATSPLACHLVNNEAACLRDLADHAALATHCPRLLGIRQIDNGLAIAIEGVVGQPTSTRLSSLHCHLLSTLASGPPQPAIAGRLITDLLERAHEFQERGVPVLQLLTWVRETLDELVLPQTIVHGDFAPWNLRVGRGKLLAFDWEYGRFDGLPLLDEIHHLVQVGFLVHDWSVTRALEELRRHAARGRPGLRREQIQALQAVYLLDAYLRRKEEGHPASDALLARQAEMITCVAFSIGLAVA